MAEGSLINDASAALPPHDAVLGRVVAVREGPAQAGLTAATIVGATTIPVSDTTIFDEAGGSITIIHEDGVTTETKTYSAVDDDAETITVAALTNAYTDGSIVRPQPTVVLKEALVRRDDNPDEVIAARIPHRMYDALIEGIRTELEQEAVMVAFDGIEWVLYDILGQEPFFDGSYVDPGTLPVPPLTDGLAPSGSPTPTLVGGIGSIFVGWVGIANPDLVKYEVHISTSSGFTPGAGTFAGETPATRFVIRTLPGTTNPPAYGTTYYVKLIAKDDDGAAAAGAQASITPETGTADTIIAGMLAANSVLAESLEAIMVLATRIVAGSPTGARVQIGFDENTGDLGITAYAPDGATVTFSVDGGTGEVFVRGPLAALGQVEWGTGSKLLATDIIEQAQQMTGFETVAPVQTSVGASYASGGFGTFARGFSANATPGNLLLIAMTGARVGSTPSNFATPTAKDVNGNAVAITATLLDNKAGTVTRQMVWAVENCPANVRSITVASGATTPQYGALAIHEFAGLAIASAFDKEPTTTPSGVDNSPTVSGSAANAQADELAFACVSGFDVTPHTTEQPSLGSMTSGYAQRSTVHTIIGGGNRLSQFSVYKRETAVVTSAFAATILGADVGSVNWIAYLATFKAKAAGLATPATDRGRLAWKQIANVARPVVKQEDGYEGAVVLGRTDEVWRREIVAVSGVNLLSYNAHSGRAETLTVTGAVVGDYVEWVRPADATDVRFLLIHPEPLVTVNGQVQMTVFNTDTVARDPASTTFHVSLLHRA